MSPDIFGEGDVEIYFDEIVEDINEYLHERLTDPISVTNISSADLYREIRGEFKLYPIRIKSGQLVVVDHFLADSYPHICIPADGHLQMLYYYPGRQYNYPISGRVNNSTIQAGFYEGKDITKPEVMQAQIEKMVGIINSNCKELNDKLDEFLEIVEQKTTLSHLYRSEALQEWEERYSQIDYRVITEHPDRKSAKFQEELENQDSNTAEYVRVLDIINRLGHAIEKTPSIFPEANEEEIRDAFVSLLDVQFPGSTTAETYNARGKADILMKKGGENIFLAECLIWDGEEEFQKKVNQLREYFSPTDRKAALIIYNKTKTGADVPEKVSGVLNEYGGARELSNNSIPYEVYQCTNFDSPNQPVDVVPLVYHLPPNRGRFQEDE